MFVEILLVRFVNVVTDPAVRYDPVFGCATQIHEHPKISYVLQVQWGVGWLGFIGSCVPVALPFRFHLNLDRATVVRVGRMQMDLPCSARGYGRCAAPQQFSFDVPSALAIKFVTVHTPSADCDKLSNASLSALYTSHQGAFNHTLMPDRCHEEHLEVDAINQALRLSPHSHIRDVYNAERQPLAAPGSGNGTDGIGSRRSPMFGYLSAVSIRRTSSMEYGGLRECMTAWQFGQTGRRSVTGPTSYS